MAASLDNRQGVTRYRLPPDVLPARQVRYLGIEELPPEGRKVAAAHAAQLARAKGIETFPFPEIGQRFDFALTAEDGRPVNSQLLRGKVIVLQCWADWHAGSLQQRRDLRQLYERRHADGLEVIGIDLNHDLKARGPASPERFPWPNIRVPREGSSRELWILASEILALPRVLVLNRRGILRLDNPTDLEKAIVPLLREP
jgi:hypothetical protein